MAYRAGRLRLLTLGRLRLIGPEGDLLPGRKKELLLLTYLARRSPQPVPRSELATLLWGDRPERKARHSLRQALLLLRRAIGEVFEVSADAIALPEGIVELDVRIFEREVGGTRPEDALVHWKGWFLADAEDAGCEACRVWIQGEREALRRRAVGALQRLADGAESDAAWQEASVWAERWAELAPLDEEPRVRWLRALVEAGRVAEARAVYEAYAARLREELDLEPGEALQRLRDRLEPPATEAASSEPQPGPAAAAAPPGEDEAVLAELAEAWRLAQRGGCRLRVLCGEAEQRTSLCDGFVRRVRSEGETFVLRAAGSARETVAAWSSARQLLSGLHAAPGLAGSSPAYLAEVGLLVPRIHELYPDLPEPSGEDEALQEAIAAVLCDVAYEVPLLLVVDDAANADPQTRRLLATVALRYPEAAVLMVLAVGPGEPETVPELSALLEGAGARRLELGSDRQSPFPRREPHEPARRSADTADAHTRPAVGEPSPTAPAAAPRHKRSRWRRHAAVAVLLLAFAAGALGLALNEGDSLRRDAATAAGTVVILPFSYHGSGSDEYLAEGMIDLLAATLNGADDLRALDPHAVLGRLRRHGSATPDPAGAARLAEHFAAEFYVLGSIVEAGEQLHLSAALYDARSGRPLAQPTVSGARSDLLSLVDALAAQLLVARPGIPPTRLASLAATSTRSLPALRSYLEGESALRSGEWDRALLAFAEAVRLDSMFAAANLRLHLATGGWTSQSHLADGALERALRQADRLPLQDRKLLEAVDAMRQGRPHEAERLYRQILTLQPEHLDAWYLLAELYFWDGIRIGRSKADAADALRRAVELDPSYFPALVHLIELAFRDRDEAAVDSLLRRAYPDGQIPLRFRAALALLGPDTIAHREALAELRDGSFDDRYHAAVTIVYAEAFEATTPINTLQKQVGTSPWQRVTGYRWQANVELVHGRWAAGRRELEAAARLIDQPAEDQILSYWEALGYWAVPFDVVPADELAAIVEAAADRPLPPTVRGVAARALAAARVGNEAEARRAARALARWEGSAAERRYAANAAGYVRLVELMRAGRPADVLALTARAAPPGRHMASARDELPSRHIAFAQAEALLELDRLDDALFLYREIADHKSLILVRALAYLRIAELEERLGRPSAARHAYQRVLEFWPEPDPHLRWAPERARARLARLRAET